MVIDCVRFGCAMMVLAFHYLTVFPYADTAATHLFDPAVSLPTGGARWTWYGWVGVEIFFVISGYVIAMSAARSGRLAFLRRRLLRLAPAAWICATLTALILIGGANAANIVAQWLASVTFWPLGSYVDSAYWTLTVELVFYLLVSIWLRDGQDNSRKIEHIGWALGVLSAGYWVAAVMLNLPPDTAVETPLRLMLMPHGAFFALGISLWSIRAFGRERKRMLLAGLAMMAGLTEVAVHARTIAGVAAIAATPVTPVLIFSGAIALIACASRVQRPLIATFGQGRLETLGRMTYPLYLLNQVAGAALLVWLCAAGMPASMAIGSTTIVVVATAWVIAVYLEPRVRRALAAALPS